MGRRREVSKQGPNAVRLRTLGERPRSQPELQKAMSEAEALFPN